MDRSNAQPSPTNPQISPPRADQVEKGPQFPPERLVTLYSSAEWEVFIRDWTEILKDKYHSVERLGGAGDQGRDIAGYVNAPNTSGPWDNFQAKHYDHPLAPSDVWVEFGKLCHYTFTQAYTIPREYRFVAPQDMGTKLWNLMTKPENLRSELIVAWDRYCRNGITDKFEVPLTGEFREYVESFDFSIVGYVPVRKIIEQFRLTPYFVTRFGGGLPVRPAADLPPTTIAPHETRYVRQLLDAYSECLACTVGSFSSLSKTGIHRKHFDRSREDFYRADSLRVFSRATVPAGTFESLQDEVYRGVVDIAESAHKDGFERVKETVKAARNLPIHSHALVSVLTHDDKSGICHQLANSDKLIWVKPI